MRGGDGAKRGLSPGISNNIWSSLPPLFFLRGDHGHTDKQSVGDKGVQDEKQCSRKPLWGIHDAGRTQEMVERKKHCGNKKWLQKPRGQRC